MPACLALVVALRVCTLLLLFGIGDVLALVAAMRHRDSVLVRVARC